MRRTRAERRRLQAEAWCDRFEENNKKWLKSTIADLGADGEPELELPGGGYLVDFPHVPRLYGIVGGEVIEEVWNERSRGVANE